jgi:hypothetical protein
MAFIHNQLAVFRDEIIHNTPASEALDHCDIDDTSRLAHASTNLADTSLWQLEKAV